MVILDGDTTWGSHNWGVATMDGVYGLTNQMGADLPMVLILTVLLAGFNIRYDWIFIGPVVLAVAHSLLNAWINSTKT